MQTFERYGRRVIVAVAAAIGIFFQASEPHAQNDPRAVLATIIAQLQTGTENPQGYSPALWQTIVAQTGGTGIYAQLRSMGPVQFIVVDQAVALPGGMVFAMRAQHPGGVSFWNFGLSAYRVEYANFSLNQPMPIPVPYPTPTPSGPPQRTDPPPPIEQGPSSPACQKFPNLC